MLILDFCLGKKNQNKTKTQLSGLRLLPNRKRVCSPVLLVFCWRCVFSAHKAQFSWHCVAHTCRFMNVKWNFSWAHNGSFLLLSTPVLCESVWTWLRWSRRRETVGAVSHWSRGTVQFLRQGFLHCPLSFLRCKRLPVWTGSKALFSLWLNSRAVCRILSCFKKRRKREAMWSVTTGSRRSVSSSSAETLRDWTCKLHCFSVHSFFIEVCHKHIISTSNKRTILFAPSFLVLFHVNSILHIIII